MTLLKQEVVQNMLWLDYPNKWSQKKHSWWFRDILTFSVFLDVAALKMKFSSSMDLSKINMNVFLNQVLFIPSQKSIKRTSELHPCSCRHYDRNSFCEWLQKKKVQISVCLFKSTFCFVCLHLLFFFLAFRQHSWNIKFSIFKFVEIPVERSRTELCNN